VGLGADDAARDDGATGSVAGRGGAGSGAGCRAHFGGWVGILKWKWGNVGVGGHVIGVVGTWFTRPGPSGDCGPASSAVISKG
jgi:hypothetical protein